MRIPFQSLLEFILTIQIWDVVKFFISLGLFLYIIFAVIVIRQINLMARTLVVPITLPFKTAAWAHLGLAIFVFLVALIFL